jgi:flavorubredoxin
VSGSGAPAREIALGIYWLGQCVATRAGDDEVHVHNCAFLVCGADRSLLVDTGLPVHWPDLEKDLDRILGDRALDYLVPTHPEVPHMGNLAQLLSKYPVATVVGDVRDYHLYLPGFANRLDQRPLGSELDLGGGYRFTFLEALIRDLPGSLWGYEHSQRVMFVADGFAYVHTPFSEGGEPVHRPGHCRLMTSEMAQLPSVEQAAYLTRGSLGWSRYLDAGPIFERIVDVLARYPPALIAPAHGNVIDEVERMLPVVMAAHDRTYRAELGTGSGAR